MSDAYHAAENNRRMENLIRVGTIEVLAAGGCVRVRMGDTLTAPLQVINPRSGPDSAWWQPEPGEQVLVLSPSGDMAQGVVIAGLWSNAFPPVADSPDIARVVFKNGDLIEHDRSTGRLLIDVAGTVTIRAGGGVIIEGSVTQTGGDMTSDGISAQHHVHPGVARGAATTDEPA